MVDQFDEWLSRPDELTEEEHEILDNAVVHSIWDAVNDAFEVNRDIYEEIFGKDEDDNKQRSFKDDIALDLIAKIGVLLRELGPLAPHYVPKPGDVISLSRVAVVIRRLAKEEKIEKVK